MLERILMNAHITLPEFQYNNNGEIITLVALSWDGKQVFCEDEYDDQIIILDYKDLIMIDGYDYE